MLNLLIALAATLVGHLLFSLPRWLSAYEALAPAVLVGVGTYVVLARRTFRQLEARMQMSGRCLQGVPPQFAEAVRLLERGYPLARWQFGIRAQLDAQLGVLFFLTREFNRAQPLLARSLFWSPWLAGAMLGVIQYKKKDVAGMKRTMGVVTKKAKKQGLVHSLYGYLLCQVGEREEAQRVLSLGVRQAGSHDPRVAEALLALQNGKKIKMRAYKEQWYQFHLESPPQRFAQAPRGTSPRGGHRAVRGRW